MHYFILYIIPSRKNGAYLEAVETHGRRAPALVAHYDYDCAVDKVADYVPVETPGKRKPPAPKKFTDKSEAGCSSGGEALFGMSI